MESLISEVTKELKENILPFWENRMPDSSDGFIGRIDGSGKACPEADKGAIMNARILWTFSSAWRTTRERKRLEMAERSYRYITSHFLDREYGGVFWSLDAEGMPKDSKKQFYAIAFMIYALAEYYRAVGDEDALSEAVKLYRCIEEHSLDKVQCGYFEACTRDWDVIDDMRLSDKDQNDAKTMNTHLHILEAYTGLYRVWPDKGLAAALRRTIYLFLERIIGDDGHLILFFDEKWQPQSTVISYGHDIEASWLLCEAAAVLGDDVLTSKVKRVSQIVADASMKGFDMDAGMEHEFDPVSGRHNLFREWWVQAETVVGCVNQYQITGDKLWKDRALHEWSFIKNHIVCPDGEWYWGALPDGDHFVPDVIDDRAGFWKCPYHNGRMCMELMER